jgi:ketosteroid isomerase-like protein
MDSTTERTTAAINGFFEAIGRGDGEAIMNCLAPNIIFELPVDRYNSIIPYLGVKHGRQEVAEAFRVRAETTEVLSYEVRDLVVQDFRAFAVIFTAARARASGLPFEIEDAHRLVVNEAGEIARWKVYFDPNTEVAAFRAGTGD